MIAWPKCKSAISQFKSPLGGSAKSFIIGYEEDCKNAKLDRFDLFKQLSLLSFPARSCLTHFRDLSGLVHKNFSHL